MSADLSRFALLQSFHAAEIAKFFNAANTQLGSGNQTAPQQALWGAPMPGQSGAAQQPAAPAANATAQAAETARAEVRASGQANATASGPGATSGVTSGTPSGTPSGTSAGTSAGAIPGATGMPGAGAGAQQAGQRPAPMPGLWAPGVEAVRPPAVPPGSPASTPPQAVLAPGLMQTLAGLPLSGPAHGQGAASGVATVPAAFSLAGLNPPAPGAAFGPQPPGLTNAVAQGGGQLAAQAPMATGPAGVSSGGAGAVFQAGTPQPSTATAPMPGADRPVAATGAATAQASVAQRPDAVQPAAAAGSAATGNAATAAAGTAATAMAPSLSSAGAPSPPGQPAPGHAATAGVASGARAATAEPGAIRPQASAAPLRAETATANPSAAASASAMAPSLAEPTAAVRQAVQMLVALDTITLPGGALVAAADGSRAMATAVIYNAAMIPGWPFATAFAQDGPRADLSALRDLGRTLERMTPEQMAEYLAKMGANYRVLEHLRRILRAAEKTDGEKLLGFLAVLGAAVGQVLEGLRASLALREESIALLAEVPAGGDMEREGMAANRRRLRL